MKQNFWIDTDVGSDDAVALIMALRSKTINVIGMSAVCGNVPMMQAAKNARFVAEMCDSDVPVYLGAEKPLRVPYADAKWFHGEDGLAGYGEEPKKGPETGHAVDAFIAAVKENSGLTLVTLGPLTNIALAVAREPSIVEHIGRCVVMGGAAATYGNVTPAAEYNIWVDPDAARMVFLSGMPIEMVGWEFCHSEFALSFDEMDTVRSFDTPFAHFTLDSNEVAIEAYYKQSGEHGLALPDAVTMAVALDPSIATETSKHYVEIETQSSLTRGMTVVDKLNQAETSANRDIWAQVIGAGKNVSVTWAIDNQCWKELLYSLLR